MYPLLKTLERNGYIQSAQEKHGGRIRKIYSITPKGMQLVDAYYEFLEKQIAMKDHTGSGKDGEKTKL
jgi:DNA-binding PadR family transcriptional regulator